MFRQAGYKTKGKTGKQTQKKQTQTESDLNAWINRQKYIMPIMILRPNTAQFISPVYSPVCSIARNTIRSLQYYLIIIHTYCVFSPARPYNVGNDIGFDLFKFIRQNCPAKLKGEA